jgi:hypothetical protein
MTIINGKSAWAVIIAAATMWLVFLGASAPAFCEEARQTAEVANDPSAGDVDDSADLKKIGHSGRAHIHEGFMLRFATGAGYSADTTNESGIMYEANAKVGFTLVRNLAVSVEFDFSVAFTGSTHVRPNYFLGPSLDYYFMPANVFVSVSLGYDQLWFGQYNVTRYGIAGIISIGKEWWVSEEWGVGLMLRNSLIGTIQGIDQFCYQGALMVSATYY